MFLLCLAAAAWPASDWSRPPVVSRTVLGNGMVVILEENHFIPWASVNIFVRSGGRWEDPTTSGLSHFCEHMFFRGTTHRSGIEVKTEIEGLGGQTDAETSQDFTHFFVNLPSVHVAQCLDIMADCIQNPALDPKAINVERQAVLDEYRMDEDSPIGVMEAKLYSLAYAAPHPYHLSVIGTEANINRFKQPDFIAWYRSRFVPERSALVVVGDFRSSDLMPQIHRLFDGWNNSGIPVPHIAPPEPLTRNINERAPAKVRGSFTMLGWRAPPCANHTDICAVDLMTFLLGQGKSSLLYKRLVTDKELAQAVSVDFQTQKDPGLIILSIAGSGPRLQAAREAALGLIGEVQGNQFSDADLEKARAMLLAEVNLGNEPDDGEAGSLGFYEMNDSMDFALHYTDGIRRVTRQDVVRVAKTYLGAPHVQVIALPDGIVDPTTLPKPTRTVK
ncbi:MAG: M16 family metallopeptidase [Candidatus Xenobia bacterium]